MKASEKAFEEIKNNSTYKNRYDICQACESFNKEKKKCNDCGCFLPLKIVVPFASCHKGKW